MYLAQEYFFLNKNAKFFPLVGKGALSPLGGAPRDIKSAAAGGDVTLVKPFPDNGSRPLYIYLLGHAIRVYARTSVSRRIWHARPPELYMRTRIARPIGLWFYISVGLFTMIGKAANIDARRGCEGKEPAIKIA